jgi:hypothetical protein
MRISMTPTLAAIALVAAFAQSAYADITVKSQDGTVEMTLPNGWREAKKAGPNAKIHATDGHSARVTVRVEPKEDFKDLKAFAEFMGKRLKKKFVDADPKFEDVQVAGKPAIRISLMGQARSGKRAGYIMTLFEGDDVYVNVMASANAGVFNKVKDVLSNLPHQIRMTSAAGPQAKAPPEPQVQQQPPPPVTPSPPATPSPTKPPARTSR